MSDQSVAEIIAELKQAQGIFKDQIKEQLEVLEKMLRQYEWVDERLDEVRVAAGANKINPAVSPLQRRTHDQRQSQYHQPVDGEVLYDADGNEVFVQSNNPPQRNPQMRRDIPVHQQIRTRGQMRQSRSTAGPRPFGRTI
ncbi:MAG: hypothetical protein GY804_09360 [Alphaproteobacteria bacterium]|nr:hypothetical protein [Alphaproteobacteria bacterium]